MELITYKSFTERAQAEALKVILKSNGIDGVIERNLERETAFPDATIFADQYHLKISPTDFEVAGIISDKASSEGDFIKYQQLSQLDNEALYHVLAASDKYDFSQVRLARKILEQRINSVDEEKIKAIEAQAVRQGRRPPDARLFVGIITVVLLFIILFVWTNYSAERAAGIAVLMVCVGAGYFLKFIEFKTGTTCPRCGKWWRVKKTAEFQNSDTDLKSTYFITQLKCYNCGKKWGWHHGRNDDTSGS